MTEVITSLVTLGQVFLIGSLKPEWLLGWQMKLLDSKLPKNQNKISNSLGLKLVESGTYQIDYHPDSETIKNETEKIKESIEVLNTEIKK